MMKRAVFLDRDGVLNHAVIKNGLPYSPLSIEELTIPSDAKAALHQLKSAGYLLIGATNQPDVARGKTTQSLVEAMHTKLMQALPLDAIYACYHDDVDACSCRKPLPGLLFQAAGAFRIDLKQSFMIGDRWKDIEAGQRAGCRTIWMNLGHLEQGPKTAPDFMATSLTEASAFILRLLG